MAFIFLIPLIFTIQTFSVIVTLLGPENIVTITVCHNNRLFYFIKLLFWTSSVDKNCHNKQFVRISVVIIT